MGDTSVSPFDLGTFGSRSMPDAGPRLRRAAAAARRVLRETAGAARTGLSAGDLTFAGGRVAGPDGAPAVSYAELVAGQRRVEHARAYEELTPVGTWQAQGRATRAAGAVATVTGRKRFPADLALEGMRHGCVLRPPAYGARLRTVDVSAAETMPGVRVVR